MIQQLVPTKTFLPILSTMGTLKTVFDFTLIILTPSFSTVFTLHFLLIPFLLCHINLFISFSVLWVICSGIDVKVHRYEKVQKTKGINHCNC